MGKAPEIRLGDRQENFSGWFIEKSREALKHLARAVDRMPDIGKEPPYRLDLAAAIRYNVSIFAMVSGFEQELDITDADLVVNEGTVGLQKLAKKYGVEIK
ncbi:MAG: hypothetical protein FWC27_05930 [Firmicutes bacterium]|nr:hypothetical protein [Bacillota bacterium]